VAAAAGSAHTAVVTRDEHGGGLYMFGSNQFGQLGCVGIGAGAGGSGGLNGDDSDGGDGGDDGDDVFCAVGGTSGTPLLIDFDDADADADADEGQDAGGQDAGEGWSRPAAWVFRVIEVSCGSRHTAAVVASAAKGVVTTEAATAAAAVVTTTGLFTWGWNAHGQLGLGDRRNRPAPRRVPVAVPPRAEVNMADRGTGRGGIGTGVAAARVAHVSCGWGHTVVGVLDPAAS